MRNLWWTVTQDCNFVEAFQPPPPPPALQHHSIYLPNSFIHVLVHQSIYPFTINKAQFQQMKCHKITHNMAKPYTTYNIKQQLKQNEACEIQISSIMQKFTSWLQRLKTLL
jgi:hypothetical protein